MQFIAIAAVAFLFLPSIPTAVKASYVHVGNSGNGDGAKPNLGKLIDPETSKWQRWRAELAAERREWEALTKRVRVILEKVNRESEFNMRELEEKRRIIGDLRRAKSPIERLQILERLKELEDKRKEFEREMQKR